MVEGHDVAKTAKCRFERVFVSITTNTDPPELGCNRAMRCIASLRGLMLPSGSVIAIPIWVNPKVQYGDVPQ